MKRLLIIALMSLFVTGTAFAEYSTDYKHDLIYGQTRTQDLQNMPATAVGRTPEVQKQEQINYGGMQDHPSERVSGI